MRFGLTFMATLIDENIIQDGILPNLLEDEFREIEDIKQLVPVADVQICEDPSLIEQKLMNGYVMLTIETELKHFGFIAAQKK